MSLRESIGAIYHAVMLFAISVSLAGCALFGGQTTPVPVTDVRPFKPIAWRCATASGEARVGILEHNSVLASLKTGKEVVYTDDCPKPKPGPKEPKTS